MAKTKSQKQEVLKKLQDKAGKAKSVIFTHFNGLGVKENEVLRKELLGEKSEYYVAKKTLLNLAFKDKNIKNLEIKALDGQVAAVFGYDDEVAPARIVHKFKKKNEGKIDFIGGILENKFLTAEEVSTLAQLPTKTELYTKVVGSINAPISGFVNALAGNLRNLVYVLNAVKDKK